MTELNLWGNPLIVPPIEVANKGIDDIKEYFRQLREEGEDYIYAAILILEKNGYLVLYKHRELRLIRHNFGLNHEIIEVSGDKI